MKISSTLLSSLVCAVSASSTETALSSSYHHLSSSEDDVGDTYNKDACEARPRTIPNPYPQRDSEAPEFFTVEFHTTVNGTEPIVMEVTRSWAPIGVDRFWALVQDHYYDCAAFFRVVPGFVVQFGIASTPDESDKWDTPILDDPVTQSNLDSHVSFATAGPDSRMTQIFVNTADNPRLDAAGFAPFARVVRGMDTVRALSDPTPGSEDGVDQGRYMELGNAWILSEYPEIDIIKGVPQH